MDSMIQDASTNSVGSLRAEGYSKVQVGNNYSINVGNYQERKHDQCLADLRLTDPGDDKARIEQTKGGLLKGSYSWILNHEDFRRWRDDRQSRLLWIKGDAGKGKTMLMCGIIDELSRIPTPTVKTKKGGVWADVAKKMSRRLRPSPTSPSQLPARSHVVSFFFCQGTDLRLNHATAVLRGLMYVLLRQVPSLISHIQEKYDHSGQQLFEDPNVFYTLSHAFKAMLSDPRAEGCCMVIDALDECESGLQQLLGFIAQSTTMPTGIKWIVSSRYRHDIEQYLHFAESKMTLSLESNSGNVTEAINTYIDYQIANLVSLDGNKSMKDRVRDELQQKADGTFLWVAFVTEKLRNVQSWDVLSTLDEMPAGLVPLYRRMMETIQHMKPQDSKLCQLVLLSATIAYRPLHLCELGVLAGLPGNISEDTRSLAKVADMCGSFLTIRNDRVYLVHQTVKDFLMTEGSITTFPNGLAAAHLSMFQKSLKVMTDTLQRDVYNIRYPGTSINEIRRPEADPLSSIRYSCIYWADHLIDATPRDDSSQMDSLQDGGIVYQFLSTKFLHWLEALSLLRALPEGELIMRKLESLLSKTTAYRLLDLAKDEHRFMLSHRRAMEVAPLQVYSSALIFSPKASLTRNLFREEEPTWVTKPRIRDEWDACLATLEAHEGPCLCVAFSVDGQRLASSGSDAIIKIWNPETRVCLTTLKGHRKEVVSVAFSPDGKRIASASWDKTIKIWSLDNQSCLWTLHGHDGLVTSVAFSPACAPYGERLASSSDDKTVKIWDSLRGDCIATFQDHKSRTEGLSFSPDGQRLASGGASEVKIWDVASGDCLPAKFPWVTARAVAFSPDDIYLAIGDSSEKNIRIYDSTTNYCVTVIEDRCCNSVAFSPNGKQLATGADDGTIKIWEISTSQCLRTFKGHTDKVFAIAYWPNTGYLASASMDNTIKIWDPTIDDSLFSPEGHNDEVFAIVFSPNSKLVASGSFDGIVKTWDTATGHLLSTLNGHSQAVCRVAFSPDSMRIYSASRDGNVKVWDASSCRCLMTISHSDPISTIAVSPDGERLVSSSTDKTLRIWDAMTGNCIKALRTEKTIDRMRFDQGGKGLYTSHGFVDISPFVGPKTATLLYNPGSYSDLELWGNFEWIAYKERKLLWIPLEYRSLRFAAAPSAIAVGCVSGRVVIFRFSGKVPGLDEYFPDVE